MVELRRSVVLVALVALTIGGCTTASSRRSADEPPAQARRGGELTLLSDTTVRTWDPQEISDPATAQLASRLFMRTLTMYAPPAVPGTVGPTVGAPDLVGDLAVGTGTATDGGRTWSFLLRTGALWQDGKQVTCADLRYGISRSFDPNRPGGTHDAAKYLDLPRVASGPRAGSPKYTGPQDRADQAGFDAAVSCVGPVVTFHLRVPVSDFPAMVSLPEFAPYRQDIDQRTSDRYTVFSDGPYFLEGDWHPGQGGTFSWNYNWNGLTDSWRQANPAIIRIEENVPDARIVAQAGATSGSGRYTAAISPIPPSLRDGVVENPSLASRRVVAPTGTVDYLLARPDSRALADPAVRTAFATATDRAALVTALGGAAAAAPLDGLVPASAGGSNAPNPLGVTDSGDPAKAAAMLSAAGVSAPVRVRLGVAAGSPLAQALPSLLASWQRGGFAVTVVPLPASDVLAQADPATAGVVDLVATSVHLDWRSAGAVIPAVLGVTPTSAPDVPADIAAQIALAAGTIDPTARDSRWALVDRELVRRGIVVPLAERRAVFVHGQAVQQYAADPISGVPDLGVIAVEPSSGIR